MKPLLYIEHSWKFTCPPPLPLPYMPTPPPRGVLTWSVGMVHAHPDLPLSWLSGYLCPANLRSVRMAVASPKEQGRPGPAGPVARSPGPSPDCSNLSPEVDLANDWRQQTVGCRLATCVSTNNSLVLVFKATMQEGRGYLVSE